MAQKKCPVCGASYADSVVFCATDGTRLQRASDVGELGDPMLGKQIAGRYRVLRRLGEGGMGVVYLAEHEAIEKKVAIKVLKEPYAARHDVVARFQQEAKSASRVKHEGVLEVFDFGRTEDDRFFLVMELLEGVDLAHVLEREHTLAADRVVRLGVQIARALGAAHQKGVVHRDLKPENVFVRVDDVGREHIKIVDFGIAQLRAEGEAEADPNAKVSGRKLTRTGMIFGTPEYMSPEGASGKPTDQRVDVYALGVILFELLTGRTPFQGETFLAILNAHVMEPIPPLSVYARPGFSCSPELEGVVRSCLAKDPEGRFRTMGDVVEALLATPEGAHEAALRSSMRAMSLPPSSLEVRVAPAKVSIAPPSNRAHDPSAATIIGTTGEGAQIVEAHLVRPSAQMRDVAATRAEISTRGDGDDGPGSTSTEAAVSDALTVMPRPRRSRAPIIAALSMIVGGGGAFVAYRTMHGHVSEPAASVAPSSTPIQPAVASVTAAPSVSASASAEKPVAQLVVHVESTPAGAIVEREVGSEWAQVCDATPCDVKVDSGATVHLRATKGAAVGDKKLLVDHEQKAVLALVAPKGQPKPKASTENLCEVLLDEGIKVWRPCGKK